MRLQRRHGGNKHLIAVSGRCRCLESNARTPQFVGNSTAPPWVIFGQDNYVGAMRDKGAGNSTPSMRSALKDVPSDQSQLTLTSRPAAELPRLAPLT